MIYLVFHLVRRHPSSIHRGGNWAVIGEVVVVSMGFFQ